MSGPDERRGTDGGEHPLDVDARFADIVAHFHDGEPAAPRLVDDAGAPDGTTAGTDDGEGGGPDRVADDAVGGSTDAEDAADRSDAGVRPPTGPAGGPRRHDDQDGLLAELEADERAEREARAARLGAEVDRAVDGPDSHYVPDDPPPLPRPSDLSGRLAWAGVLLGPLLLLLCAMLWRSAPPWLVGSIATAMVAGFVYLVWRLPRTRDRDDPGDGAIV